MSTVGLVVHEQRDEAAELAREAADWLLGHGHVWCGATAGQLRDREVEIGELDFQRTHELARGHIVRLDP